MKRLSPKTLVMVVSTCFLGVVLALVEAELPVDTPIIEALAFWLTITCTTALLLTRVDGAIGDLLIEVEAKPPLKAGIGGLVSILLVTLPVALMCLPIDSLLPDSDDLFAGSSKVESMAALLWRWADQYINLLPAIAGFWVFVRALEFAFPAHAEAPALTTSQQTDEPRNSLPKLGPSALERRFPEISGRKLLAIEADEHYVRLHTDSGSEHVLYRFRDALNDVEETPGLRVHRSWWVAEDAIEELEQGPSGFGLRLKGDLRAPVSQTYRRDVERTIKARANQE